MYVCMHAFICYARTAHASSAVSKCQHCISYEQELICCIFEGDMDHDILIGIFPGQHISAFARSDAIHNINFSFDLEYIYHEER